jgi:hypothetical protein
MRSLALFVRSVRVQMPTVVCGGRRHQAESACAIVGHAAVCAWKVSKSDDGPSCQPVRGLQRQVAWCVPACFPCRLRRMCPHAARGHADLLLVGVQSGACFWVRKSFPAVTGTILFQRVPGQMQLAATDGPSCLPGGLRLPCRLRQTHQCAARGHARGACRPFAGRRAK